jgi:hypothetical protein
MNKNIDIKFIAHDTFLKKPSLGTLKSKEWKDKVLGAIKPKGLH